jgi:hypothetical protein
LTGHTVSYTAKLAAERAARRVYGVKAVANDLKVQPPSSPRDDTAVATATSRVLDGNVQIPAARLPGRG